MTSVDVKNLRGEVVGSFDLDDRVFGIEPNRAVVHQAVVAQLANQRKGTARHQDARRSPWRHAQDVAPEGHWPCAPGRPAGTALDGGGVVFGPHPRSYHKDLPRKMRRLAMRRRCRPGWPSQALTVIDELDADSGEDPRGTRRPRRRSG